MTFDQFALLFFYTACSVASTCIDHTKGNLMIAIKNYCYIFVNSCVCMLFPLLVYSFNI